MPSRELGRTWLREVDAWRSLADGETLPDPGTAPVGWDPIYDTTFATNDGWTLQTETQANDNSYNHPDNVIFGDPRGMVILGKRENRGGRPFTTGDALGRHVTVPNYFRADVTATLPTDYGMWPCPLWFRPLNSSVGEIDLCETWTYDWGTNPRLYSTIWTDYEAPTPPPRQQGASLPYSALANPDPGAPHTYTCIKTQGRIEFLADGVRVYCWQDGATYNATQKIGPPPTWYDATFEVANRTWYPRINLQLGGPNTDDPPPEWEQSEVVIHQLKIYREAS